MLALRESIAAHVPNRVLPLPAVAQQKNYIPGTGKSSFLEFSLSPASLSSQGDLAIIPSGNDAIIWSTGSPARFRSLRGHKNIVGAAAFSPDGRLAFTTSADNSTWLWDVATGKPLQRLGHGDAVNGAVFNRAGGLLVTLADDSVARVWLVGADAPRCELKGPGNFVAASFSQDERYLVTVTHDDGEKAAQVWDVAAPSCPPVQVPMFEGVKDADKLKLSTASFADGGPWLGLVTVDGRTIVRSSADWKLQRELVPDVLYTTSAGRLREDRRPPAIAWSSDGHYYAAAGGDNIVRVEAIKGARSTVGLRGHTGRVTDIRFDASGYLVLTTSEDRTARIWRLGSDRRLLESLALRGHSDTVGSGLFVRSGAEVITASDDGTVRSWTLPLSLKEREFDNLHAASFSADGKRIWVAEGNKIHELPPTGTLESLNTFESPTKLSKPVLALHRSDEPRVIEIREESGPRGRPSRGTPEVRATPSRPPMGIAPEVKVKGIEIRGVRDLATKVPVQDVEGIQNVRISHQGRFIVGNTSDSIKVWDVNKPQTPREVVPPLTVDKTPCLLPTISGKGDQLAWYCPERDRVVITPLGQGERTAIQITDKKRVEGLRFSRNGGALAVTLDDYSVQVIDSHTGKTAATLRGHTGAISGIDFSHDDRFLATASRDFTARVCQDPGRVPI
jgi:WD40 repeat protein